MLDVTKILASIQPAGAGLIGASLATAGWVYTARRARALARKQHTLNVMVQARFNADFKRSEAAVSPTDQSTRVDVSDPACPNREDFKTILNFYEFLAAGIRNGDFDEQMVKDSLRGTILNLYEACEAGIFKVRTSRRRQALYEHLEWLHARWETHKPGWFRRLAERLVERPLAGRRKS